MPAILFSNNKYKQMKLILTMMAIFLTGIFQSVASTESLHQILNETDTMETHNHNQAAMDRYKMLLLTDTSDIEAGKNIQLVLKPVMNSTQHVMLEESHEKMIHLIIVSNDLSYFNHIHPEPDGNNFVVETVFPSAGNYLLFAEYKPMGEQTLVQKIQLNVKGKPTRERSEFAIRNVSTTGDYKVTLEISGGKLTTGVPVHIPVTFMKDQTTIDAGSFDDYLGAKAHAIIIGMGNKTFMHAHPMVQQNSISVQTEFDEPGIYRLWLQFKADGVLHTADFILAVEKNSIPQNHELEHQH
jgi:hypothetical protein